MNIHSKDEGRGKGKLQWEEIVEITLEIMNIALIMKSFE